MKGAVDRCDLCIVGAGAAGLMAAIWAGRTLLEHRAEASVLALDSARKLGAKILVSGGGRCNVTHDVVDESAYAGSSRHAIRKILGRFDVARTVAFFRELGVDLKREETGKLFPVTDDANTVLGALLGESERVGTRFFHPARVTRVARTPAGFEVFHDRAPGPLAARRLVLAAGGMSLPRSGSDGSGFALARSLGHTVTPRVFPALVPLTLPAGHPLLALSGLTLHARLELRSPTGKHLRAFTGSLLITHFGVSGPCALDMSRYWTDATLDDPGTRLLACWIPAFDTLEAADRALLEHPARTPVSFLALHQVPERLARVLAHHARVDPARPLRDLPRDARRALAAAIAEYPLPITGDRGWNYAEVTAGGVPLAELHLGTMESRVCPGVHLCGEVCDVDGRLGGFNFQWAWASGHVAGVAAARALVPG